MAFQLHRLFIHGNYSTSSRFPLMSQCRTLQNYPGSCLQFSALGSGCNYNKYTPILFRKAGNSCKVTTGRLKNYGLKAKGDTFLSGSSFVDSRHNCAVAFKTQFRVAFGNSCTSYSRLQSNLSSKVSSQEFLRKRLFSDKASKNPNVQNVPEKANGSVVDGKSALSDTSLKLSDRFRKCTKSFVVRNSGRQTVVSSQPSGSVPKNLQVSKGNDGNKDASVKADGNTNNPRGREKMKQIKSKRGKALRHSAAPLGDAKVDCSKHVSDTKHLLPSNTKDEKTSVNLELSVSTSQKRSGNKKNPQTQGKKEQLGNKKAKSLSGSTGSPSDADINISKQATTSMKGSMTEKASHCSEASAVNPATETPLTADKSSFAPEKPKNTLGKPVKKMKLRKKVTDEVNKSPLAKGLRSLYPPTGRSVVVVESLTKAKIIQGYLGDMFEVLPCYGHVRDLAGRSGSVRPDDDFSMVWEVPTAAWNHLKSIKVALNGAENLILASDPDREGEAIAWHITEMLQQQNALHDGIQVSRVIFHEITEMSIKSALQAPRDIDSNLIHAYLARRALDYLIGFSISPLLWRKLPSCQSAGRVQSVALALLCDKEMEINEFKPQEYWTAEVEFIKSEPGSSEKVYSFPSKLTQIDSKLLEQLSISSPEEAHSIEQRITSSSFEVLSCKNSKERRNPPAPYITSTLQQDAANKLKFTASYTMKVAQKLYEGVNLTNEEATGLITFMRTDGLHVSDLASKDIHSLVIERYGHAFAAESTRRYFKKVKNAQEAHEAIRPTSIRRLPSMLTGILDEDSLKLYTLIWSRTMASQMVPLVANQIQIDISGTGSSLGLRSTCSKVEFLGYEAIYKDTEAAVIRNLENEEDKEDNNEEAFEVLSRLKAGDSLQLNKVELKQHLTHPPSRYSEGSLIQKLEELGIGRPSTYSSIIKVLQDRNYVTVKSQTLHPEFRGRMVSAFLSHHFSEVTDYSFTADMEAELDNVSAGITEWKGLVKDYWTRFKAYCDQAGKVDNRQVEKMLENTFGDFLFASLPNESRTCPSCSEGTLVFKVGRFGAGYFIGCDRQTSCKYIAKTFFGEDEEEDDPQTVHTHEPKLLGLHPTSNEKIFLKIGPYGSYVQLGEDRKGYSPKRASVTLVKDVNSITLKDALDFLQYPLLLGNHPEDGLPVYLKLARFGFSVRHRRTIAPVPKNLDPKKITLEKGLKLLSGKDAKKCGRPKNKPKLEESEEVF